MTDWTLRATELVCIALQTPQGQPDDDYALRFAQLRERMLQLGREMANEHAEEIAQAIESSNLVKLCKLDMVEMEKHGISTHDVRMKAAEIARSFFEKKAEPISWPKSESEIRVDEREKIARRIGSYKISQPYSDDWHRGFGQAIETATDLAMWDPRQPKTRESALEDALRRMRCDCPQSHTHGLPASEAIHRLECPYGIARRALEWKPS